MLSYLSLNSKHSAQVLASYHRLWKREWLNSALEAVLDNAGAKTSGVDGVCGVDLHEPSARARFVEELRKELKQLT
jgi:hypothetical protein